MAVSALNGYTMNEVVIGSDIKLIWAIFSETGGTIPLEDKDLSLYMLNGRGNVKVEDFQVSGNKLQWTFRGKDQKAIGDYSVRIEIRSGERMLNIVENDIFRLIFSGVTGENHQEGIVDNNSVYFSSKVSVVQLFPVIPVIGENGHWWIDGKDTGKLAYAEAGMSAYDLAVSYGYQGTLSEWIESLHGGQSLRADTEIFDFRTPTALEPPQSPTEEDPSYFPDGITFTQGSMQLYMAEGAIVYGQEGFHLIPVKHEDGNEMIVRHVSGKAIRSVKFNFEKSLSPVESGPRLNPDVGIYLYDPNQEEKFGVWMADGKTTAEVKFSLSASIEIVSVSVETLDYVNVKKIPVLSDEPASPVSGDMFYSAVKKGIGVHDGKQWYYTDRRGKKGVRVVVGRAMPMFPESGTIYVFNDRIWKVKVEKGKLQNHGSISISELSNRFGLTIKALDENSRPIPGFNISELSDSTWNTSWGKVITLMFNASATTKNAVQILGSGKITECDYRFIKIVSSDTVSPFLKLIDSRIVCVKPPRPHSFGRTSSLISNNRLVIRRLKKTWKKKDNPKGDRKYKTYRCRWVTFSKFKDSPYFVSNVYRLRVYETSRGGHYRSIIPFETVVRTRELVQG